MKRSEYFFKLMSPNWGHSQEVIQVLQRDADKFIKKIAMVFWRTQQELEGKTLEADGWEFISAIPQTDGTISLTLRAIDSYIAKYDERNRDDYMGSIFPYDATNGEPVYKTKCIIVPTQYIEDFK